MCGIAGLIGKQTQPSTLQLGKMLDCIAYRGPDDMGQWKEDNVLLGHRRLSILDLSSGGRQPMLYTERYVLVFNGEIYNYIELKEELKTKGYCFTTATDSEVIPAAYDCWGEDCQNHMNGMWAFALYDLEKKTLFCSRDRFGIKPFYYTEQDDFIAFGSEIKQLLAVLPGAPHVNGPVLEGFLSVGFLECSEDTMFREVRQLRGGHCLRCDAQTGAVEVHRWFSLHELPKQNISVREARQRFRDEFFASVSRHLRADVAVGSCLSGGLDSSAVVCTINRIVEAKTKQYAITACFVEKDCDEREYSHAAAESCIGLTLSEVFPDMNHLLTELDDMIWHMDEPFGSTSVFAQREVFRRSAELGLKVMLDGQGSDELLAGYPDFYKVKFSWLFRRGQWGALYREIQAYLRLHHGQKRKDKIRFFTVAALEALTPLELQNRIFRIYQRCSPNRSWLKMTKRGMDRLCEIKRSFAKSDPCNYICASLENGLTELLHYEDRNSMTFSIEARVPFLDADFASFAIGLPFSYKLRDGISKWIMREALQDVLPDRIVSRYDKMGFVTPEDLWMKQHSKELMPLLHDATERLSPWIDGDRFLKWYTKHGGERNNYRQVWRVLCASEWIKVFQVQID